MDDPLFWGPGGALSAVLAICGSSTRDGGTAVDVDEDVTVEGSGGRSVRCSISSLLPRIGGVNVAGTISFTVISDSLPVCHRSG